MEAEEADKNNSNGSRSSRRRRVAADDDDVKVAAPAQKRPRRTAPKTATASASVSRKRNGGSLSASVTPSPDEGDDDESEEKEIILRPPSSATKQQKSVVNKDPPPAMAAAAAATSSSTVTGALQNDTHSWRTIANDPTGGSQPTQSNHIHHTTISSPERAGSFGKRCMVVLSTLIILCCGAAAFFPRTPSLRTFQHIIPPKHVLDSIHTTINNNDDSNDDDPGTTHQQQTEAYLSNMTLRAFLTDPEGFHLAMAPSFFGFFGYFGMLAAWDEGLTDNTTTATSSHNSYLETKRIKSVAGASAGAMAAMLISMGISPRKAADFCTKIDLLAFADPPGIGSVFKGDIFEQLMFDFVKSQTRPGHSMQMQDSKIPVAVTGFDLQTMSTLVMTKGCVARSARASATFPLLFQPVHWFDGDNDNDDEASDKKDYILIDGGVLDGCGLEGLSVIEPQKPNKRVVNMVVGNFGVVGTGVPPGPSEMPNGLSTSELLSISMRNLPQCGPWAMENGPRAVEAADKAMLASLDLPLYHGKEDGHYELHIDASSFISP